MPIQPRPVAPPLALRSNPDTFSANAEAAIQYQWGALPEWIEGVANYIVSGDATIDADQSAQSAASSAASASSFAAQAAANSVAAGALIYSSTAAGITATTSGQFFYVPEFGGLAVFQNQSGSAVRAGVLGKPSFTLRSTLVAAVSATYTPDAGTVVDAGGLSYVRTTGATAIPDLAGWLPFGDVTPEHFGAVGDGVTDDSAAINAASAAVEKGGNLVFAKNKTYLAGSIIRIETAGKVDLNGSTLKASAALVDQLVFYGEDKATYNAITPFTITLNADRFTIPTGVALVSGDVVQLRSNTVRVTGNNHGLMATVVSVSGGVAIINANAYSTFQVDEIRVSEGFARMEICNGIFDFTAAPNVVQWTEALLIRGSNAVVKNCIFLGNAFAGIACRVFADGATIEGCQAYDWLNTQGIDGGGRVGYGFAAYGNNTVIRSCQTYNCKHGYIAGDRNIVAVNVVYEDCYGAENPGAGSGVYSSTFDFHYNVAGRAEIRNCRSVSYSNAMTLRCPAAKVVGGTFIQIASGPLVQTYEGPFANIQFEGVAYRLGASGSTFLQITSDSFAAVTGIENVTFSECRSLGSFGGFIEVTRVSDLENIVIEGCDISCERLIRVDAGTINGMIVRNNKINASVYFLRVSLAGGTEFAHDVRVSGNEIVRFASSGSNLIYLTSTAAGRLQMNRLSIKDNSIVHGVDDTATSYSINAEKIDASRFELSNNRIERGTFRCAAVNGCQIIGGLINGQILDGDMLVTNSAGATVLTAVSVLGNIGENYSVSTTGAGVTKSRYVTGDNNFSSFIA